MQCIRASIPLLLEEIQKLYQMEVISTSKKNTLVTKIKLILKDKENINEIKEEFMIIGQMSCDQYSRSAVEKCLSLINNLEKNYE